ncbi:MAG: thioredoxin-disulfide reductase [Candidatus Omnitrophica bacterium]|nr:thioredoxin-disulfide reductase [Candidatus Omnitrophota bacterium]
MYDCIIIGAGPAGLVACLYALRFKLDVLIIDKMQLGGYLNYIDALENYPGFEEAVKGTVLIEKIEKQLRNYDFNFQSKEVKSVEILNVGIFNVCTFQENFKTRSVIIATGSSPKKLGVPGEEEFLGKGVSYCAVCDAPFFKNKKVVVVGGGNTAVEEAVYLTKFAENVGIIHRRSKLRADALLQERAEKNKKIRFYLDSVCAQINGKRSVETVTIKHNSGKIEDVECSGVFIFAGMDPQTNLVKNILKLDVDGYIITDSALKTSVPGIFACGDCRQVMLRQVITACADGANAANSANKYLESLA